MKKRVFSVILSCFLLLSILPVQALAVDAGGGEFRGGGAGRPSYTADGYRVFYWTWDDAIGLHSYGDTSTLAKNILVSQSGSHYLIEFDSVSSYNFYFTFNNSNLESWAAWDAYRGEDYIQSNYWSASAIPTGSYTTRLVVDGSVLTTSSGIFSGDAIFKPDYSTSRLNLTSGLSAHTAYVYSESVSVAITPTTDTPTLNLPDFTKPGTTVTPSGDTVNVDKTIHDGDDTYYYSGDTVYKVTINDNKETWTVYDLTNNTYVYYIYYIVNPTPAPTATPTATPTPSPGDDDDPGWLDQIGIWFDNLSANINAGFAAVAQAFVDLRASLALSFDASITKVQNSIDSIKVSIDNYFGGGTPSPSPSPSSTPEPSASASPSPSPSASPSPSDRPSASPTPTPTKPPDDDDGDDGGNWLTDIIKGLLDVIGDLLKALLKAILGLFFGLFKWIIKFLAYLNTTYFAGLVPGPIWAIVCIGVPLVVLLAIIRFVRWLL